MLVQYEENGVIRTLCLGCIRAEASHTAVNTKKWSRDFMEMYDIEDHQLIVFSADAAANIQKAAVLLLKDLKGSKFFVTDETLDDESDDEEDEDNAISSEELVDDEDYEADSNDEDESDVLLAPVVQDLHGTISERIVPNSYRVACVVHQLQLAVNKWCQSVVIARMLNTSRKLAAKLRTSQLARVIRADGLPRAIIDQATRWSSKHKMTVRLALLKDFCDDHSGPNDLLKGKIFS